MTLGNLVFNASLCNIWFTNQLFLSNLQTILISFLVFTLPKKSITSTESIPVSVLRLGMGLSLKDLRFSFHMYTLGY